MKYHHNSGISDFLCEWRDDFSYANQSETSLATDDVYKSYALLYRSRGKGVEGRDSVPVKAHLRR